MINRYVERKGKPLTPAGALLKRNREFSVALIDAMGSIMLAALGRLPVKERG